MATISPPVARRSRPFVVAVLSIATCAATSAFADRYSDCNNGNTDDDSLIRGCTQIIERGRKETAKNRAAAYGLRADAYWRRDDRDDAVADITEAIAVYPKGGWLYSVRGGYRMAMGAYVKAFDDLTRAISLDPTISAAWANRGRLNQRIGHHKNAIADLTRAISGGLANDRTYSWRADSYRATDQYSQAVSDLTVAITLNPGNAEHYYQRATVRQLSIDDMDILTGDTDSAKYEAIIADYSQVIQRNDALARKFNVYRERAAAYVDKEDYDKAVADFTMAIEVAPDNADIYRERGEAYTYAKKYSLAVADYSKVIALKPGKADDYIERARAYRQEDRYDQAIADFTKAIEIDPASKTAYASRASVYMTDLKDAVRALPDLTKSVELEPDNVHSFTARAEAYLKLNERDKAMADYASAVAVASKEIGTDPTFSFSYYTRADIRTDMGDFDNAISDYSRAIDLGRDDPALYLSGRGNAYLLKGDTGKAVADYEKAASVKNKNADYLRRLAVARFDAGDFKKAATDLLRLIEMNDDAYAMLYRYLARAHTGENGGAELDANAQRLKTKAWPYAAIELLLDRRSPEATLEAARDDDRDCKAPFYVGQWHALKGDKAAATEALTTAASKCGKYDIESRSAKLALKRLAASGSHDAAR